MSKKDLTERIADIEDVAKGLSLDFFPVIFDIVNKDIMLEACTYGLPIRSRHWSYGKSYTHTKLFGELGLSKVYEIVFNNDPAYAFLMNNNPEIVNIMVAAHVYGHVHFFKNNCMFKGSDRGMIYKAAERATRVDQYIEQYGIDKVEHLMDIGFALDNHINWDLGVSRHKYPERRVVERKRKPKEFEDLLNIGDYSRRSVKKIVLGAKLPPRPEKDLLWFLINYAPLENWEKDILEIIREESYYFYPIVQTKIANEGLAVMVHAEIMSLYEDISPEEFVEFAKCHSGVVNPGSPSNINPYYLGFRVFTDIRERWDVLHEEGESDITGWQKVLEVAEEEDDASFLRNYLTKELAIDLGMFNYGYREYREPDMKDEDLREEHGIIEIKDRDLDKLIENIIQPTINYGAPLITIDEVDGDTLVMGHDDEFGPLDMKYAEKTMEYIYELWGAPVELNTYDWDDEEITYCFDESGMDMV